MMRFGWVPRVVCRRAAGVSVVPATTSDAVAAPTATAAVVVGAATASLVVAGTTLTPAALLHTTLGTQPNLIMFRHSPAATGAPTFNYFRSNAGGLVSAGDSLGIFSGVGHDGVDY